MRPSPVLEPLENRTLPSAASGLLAAFVHLESPPMADSHDVAPAKHHNNDASAKADQKLKHDDAATQADQHPKADQDQNSDSGSSAHSNKHGKDKQAEQSSLDSSPGNDTIPGDKKSSRKKYGDSSNEATNASGQYDSSTDMQTTGQLFAPSDIAAENTAFPSDGTGYLAYVPRFADAVFLDAAQAQPPGSQPEPAAAAYQDLSAFVADLAETPFATQATEVMSRLERLESEMELADVIAGLNDRAALSSVVSGLENSTVSPGDKDTRSVRSVSVTEATFVSLQNGSPTDVQIAGQPLALSASAADNTALFDGTAPGDETGDLATTDSFGGGVFFDAWHEGLPAPQPEVAPAGDKKLTVIATYLVNTPPAKQATEVTPPRVTESGPTDFVIGLPDGPSVPPSFKAADDRTAPSLPATPDMPPSPRVQTPPASKVEKVDPGNVPPDNGEQSPPDQQTDVDSDSAGEPEESGGE